VAAQMANARIVTLFVATILLAGSGAIAGPQERGPNGEIYRELLPFVGLEGVRLRVTGLSGGVLNVPGAVGDPEKTVTGLSRAEHDQLDQAVRADIAQAFATSGIPILPANGSASEARPLLAMHITWARVRPDTITVQVRIDLMEAARLVKDQSRIVWTSTWGSTYNSIASGPDLPDVVRSVARGQIDSFVRLYVRAHARPG
jgi:hypothetical protein